MERTLASVEILESRSEVFEDGKPGELMGIRCVGLELQGHRWVTGWWSDPSHFIDDSLGAYLVRYGLA